MYRKLHNIIYFYTFVGALKHNFLKLMGGGEGGLV